MVSTENKPDDHRTMRERMLAGDPYRTDGELAAEQVRQQEIMADFNAARMSQEPERSALLKQLLGEVGANTEIRSPLYVDYGSHLRIGDNCFVNYGLVALDVAPIVIGNDVQIGPNVQLLTPTHPLDAELRLAKWEGAQPISIGDNVWLGGGVIVCPGVSIGANTVVGAGAVVTRDLPAGVLAVGNPAKVVRPI